MNNTPVFTANDILVYNFKYIKIFVINERTDETNVAEERCRPISIIAKSNPIRCISTTMRIPLARLSSNTSNMPSTKPPIQSSTTNS